MRVCLMIEGQEGVTWDDWVALAAACERHGLEGLFRSDHYLGIVRRPAGGRARRVGDDRRPRRRARSGSGSARSSRP